MSHLAEVGAFLRHREETFLVGTSEESGVMHVVGLLVVLALAAQRHPPEVLWLLPLGEKLEAVSVL